MRNGRANIAIATTFLFVIFSFSALATQDPFLILSAPKWTNGQLLFTLTGEANVTYTIEGSSDLVAWFPVATNAVTNTTRTISAPPVGESGLYRTSRAPVPLHLFALAAKQGIVLKGNTISVDSYDSTDPNFSTNGRYDSAKAKDNADMTVTNIALGSLEVGNAKIKGRSYFPPFGGIHLGPQGSIGSAAWVDSGNLGIQPGRAIEERYYAGWPSVSPPPSGIIPIGGTLNGTNYQYILSSGSYAISSLTGNLLVQDGSHATLLVTDILQGSIYLGSGAALNVYVAGGSATLGTVVNMGTSVNFQYYGLSSNTNLVCNSAGHVGIIYAPNAAVKFSGGQFEGACLADSIEASGSFSFHRDEALTKTSQTR